MEFSGRMGELALLARHRGGAVVWGRITTEGSLQSLDYQLRHLESRIATEQTTIAQTEKDMAAITAELGKPWPHADRAQEMMTEYEGLCAGMAASGLVDRQEFNFGVLPRRAAA